MYVYTYVHHKVCIYIYHAGLYILITQCMVCDAHATVLFLCTSLSLQTLPIYIYTCIFIYIYIYIYIYIFVHVHVKKNIYIYIHVFCVNIHVYVYIFNTYLYTHTHTHIYIYQNICIHIHRTHMCFIMCTHISYTCIYIIYMFTHKHDRVCGVRRAGDGFVLDVPPYRCRRCRRAHLHAQSVLGSKRMMSRSVFV